MMINQFNNVYIAEYKWELIHLYNKNISCSEYLKYDIFKNIIYIYFDLDLAKKIIDAINSYKKVLIDFVNKKAKIIAVKDYKFENDLLKYFKPNFIESDLSNNDLEKGD